MRAKERLQRVVSAVMLGVLLATTGCTGTDEAEKAIAEFQRASRTLARTFQAYVAGASTVEGENYINRLVQTPGPFVKKAMEDTNLYTAEEIKLRGTAVQALGDYLAVVATLEAGGSSAQIEADAKVAGGSVATVTADVAAAIASHRGSAPPAIAGPVSTAFAVVGSVLRLIEAHKGRAEVRKSILENDGAVQELFALMAKESRELYARQTAALAGKQNMLVAAFDDEAKRAGGGGGTPGLVDLGERLKGVEREMALQPGADPTAAITAFQKAHDDLIALMKGGGSQKASLSSLIASVEAFEAEVEPLAANVQAFAMSF